MSAGLLLQGISLKLSLRLPFGDICEEFFGDVFAVVLDAENFAGLSLEGVLGGCLPGKPAGNSLKMSSQLFGVSFVF